MTQTEALQIEAWRRTGQSMESIAAFHHYARSRDPNELARIHYELEERGKKLIAEAQNILGIVPETKKGG